MSLYEGIDIAEISQSGSKQPEPKKGATASGPFPGTPVQQQPVSAVNKLNLSFLKSQLEAKKALLLHQKSPAGGAVTNAPQTPNPLASQQQPRGGQMQQKGASNFKLKPRRAVPLPLDSGGAFSIVPKALKEDKVFLFGEIMVEDEYNPTAPTDYASFKQKREQLKIKEKVAKEIAERIAREAAEEGEKRKRGAAIAPPSAFLQQQPKEEPMEEQQQQAAEPGPQMMMEPHHQPRLLSNQFGKGSVSRGLGVAANIMSRMGYREGQGLGAKEQGISRPLEVQRTGRNVGLIVGEEKANPTFTHLAEMGSSSNQSQQEMADAGWTGSADEPTVPITELLKSSTKIVLLKNMVARGNADAEFEHDLREEMAKYGQLVNVIVHETANASSSGGDADAIRVFLEFSSQAQAIKSVVDLNGRFYAGRQVRALFYPLDWYSDRRLDEAVPPPPAQC